VHNSLAGKQYLVKAKHIYMYRVRVRARVRVNPRLGRWREEAFGRARCLTLRYSLPLSVWVDPLAAHTYIHIYL